MQNQYPKCLWFQRPLFFLTLKAKKKKFNFTAKNYTAPVFFVPWTFSEKGHKKGVNLFKSSFIVFCSGFWQGHTLQFWTLLGENSLFQKQSRWVGSVTEREIVHMMLFLFPTRKKVLAWFVFWAVSLMCYVIVPLFGHEMFVWLGIFWPQYKWYFRKTKSVWDKSAGHSMCIWAAGEKLRFTVNSCFCSTNGRWATPFKTPSSPKKFGFKAT